MKSASYNWRDTSEICFGLIVQNRLDATKFASTMFCDPYREGFEEYFKNADKTKIAKLLGNAYQIALEAAGTIGEDGVVGVEWHKILRRKALNYQLGEKADKASKKLIRGDDLDIETAIELSSQFRDVADPDTVGLTVSKEIDVDEYEPTILSGYAPIDEHLGGMVESGNILIMGQTGVGKSLFSQVFLGAFLKQYPEKKAAIWSLEMTNQQYLRRGLDLYPTFRDAHEQGRILVSDKTTTIHDIGIEAASAGANIIVVDYIDYLIKGEPSEGKFAEIYIQMNNISRTLKIPFIMLLQPNRSVYESGIPRMWHARYSGMAENVSAQFWALYYPDNAKEMEDEFTYIEDSMYIIAWKQRFGWKKNKEGKIINRGPGAIVLPRTRNVWATEVGDWVVRGDVPHETKGKGRRK